MKPTLGFVMLYSAFLVAQTQASPIEQPSEMALHSNENLLRSVVKLEFQMDLKNQVGVGTCTAVKVARDTFLTAAHCAELFEVSGHVTLNENPHFRIVSIYTPPQQITPVLGERVLTDIAVFKVKPSENTRSNIESLPVVPVALDRKLHLSNRVLIAGYGETKESKADTGVLRAAFVNLSLSNFSSSQNPLREENIHSTLKKLSGQEGDLNATQALVSVIEETFVNDLSQAVGEIHQYKENWKHLGTESKGSGPLEGDSGGPAFSFDDHGKAYLVGIVSGGLGPVLNVRANLMAKNFDGEVLAASNELTTPRYQAVLYRLFQKGYLSEHAQILKPFGLEATRTQGRIQMYSSTSDATNSKFIAESIASASAD